MESTMLQPAVRLTREQGVLVADFWDCLRLDPIPVRDLRTQYEKSLQPGMSVDLLVDLGGVSFAGSAALSGFVNLQRVCRQTGGRLIFCEVESGVLESFRASHLLSLFQFIARKEDGLATLLNSQPNPDGRGVDASVKVPTKESQGSAPPIRMRRRTQ
jgi:anti-anti-sigma factor